MTTMKKINFTFEISPHCCGIGLIGGFVWQEGYVGLWPRPEDWVQPEFTQEEVLNSFDEGLTNDLYNHINEDYGFDGSPDTPKGGLLLQASFVTECPPNPYGTPKEYLFLMEHMLTQGWEKGPAFVNSNTGNTVQTIHRTVTAADYWPEREHEEELDF